MFWKRHAFCPSGDPDVLVHIAQKRKFNICVWCSNITNVGDTELLDPPCVDSCRHASDPLWVDFLFGNSLRTQTLRCFDYCKEVIENGIVGQRFA
jgi:hypothetical protein